MRFAKCTLIFIVTLAMPVLLCPGEGLAAIHHVSNSEELNAAISLALDGDIIEIADGTYDWAAGIQIEVELTMRGASGDPDAAVIRLSALDAGIASFGAFQGGETLLFEGLTFSGFDAQATLLGHNFNLGLTRCIFRDNSGWSIITANGIISAQDCVFEQNTAQYVIDSNAELATDRCSFRNNTMTHSVIEVEFGDIFLTRTEITGNTGACVRVPPTGQAVFSYCLVSDNQGTEAAMRVSASSLEMTDCTIIDNSYPDGGIVIGVYGEAFLTQCDIRGNEPRDGTLGSGSHTIFTCCDVDLVRWQRYGTFVLDNDDCGVATEKQAFGWVKVLYR